MEENKSSKDTEYRYRENNEPSKQTGNIDARNNNENNSSPSAIEPNVETANTAGLGDSGLNDTKLTNFTSNHSADA